MSIAVGLKGEASAVVNDENTAIAFGSGSVNVFATPAMIGLMEKAALSSVDPLLDPGNSTVGIKLQVEHKAATPIGMKVTASSELIEVDGRRLVFKVVARDNKEIVGEGIHERFIVPLEKFISRAEAKGQE